MQQLRVHSFVYGFVLSRTSYLLSVFKNITQCGVRASYLCSHWNLLLFLRRILYATASGQANCLVVLRISNEMNWLVTAMNNLQLIVQRHIYSQFVHAIHSQFLIHQLNMKITLMNFMSCSQFYTKSNKHN